LQNVELMVGHFGAGFAELGVEHDLEAVGAGDGVHSVSSRLDGLTVEGNVAAKRYLSGFVGTKPPIGAKGLQGFLFFGPEDEATAHGWPAVGYRDRQVSDGELHGSGRARPGSAVDKETGGDGCQEDDADEDFLFHDRCIIAKDRD